MLSIIVLHNLNSYMLFFSLFFFFLTALPFRVADFQVTAGASRVLARSIRAADILNLAVNGFQSGINLHIMLSQIVGGLISTHVTQGIRALLGLTQPSKGRHINARAWRTRRTRGSSVTWRTLRTDATKEEENDQMSFFKGAGQNNLLSEIKDVLLFHIASCCCCFFLHISIHSTKHISFHKTKIKLCINHAYVCFYAYNVIYKIILMCDDTPAI